MRGASFFIASLIWAASAIYATVSYAELKPLKLPDPQVEGGGPLMQVLRDRSSNRAFRPAKLPDQVLSNLLWAAFGINSS